MKNTPFGKEKEPTTLDVTANSYSVREAVTVKISTIKERPHLQWPGGKAAAFRARLS